MSSLDTFFKALLKIIFESAFKKLFDFFTIDLKFLINYFQKNLMPAQCLKIIRR